MFGKATIRLGIGPHSSLFCSSSGDAVFVGLSLLSRLSTNFRQSCFGTRAVMRFCGWSIIALDLPQSATQHIQVDWLEFNVAFSTYK